MLDPQYAQQTDWPRRARLRQLGGAVNKNLIQLQTEMGMLSFPRGPMDAPERKALYDLLSDMQRCANNVVETTQRLMKNITVDDPVAEEEVPVEEKDVKALETDDEPPYTPLTFQIPTDVLEGKRKIEEDSEEKYWSHIHYTNPAKKNITIHYCRTLEECEEVLPQYLKDRVVGFDMEWCENDKTGTVRKNISMIQVANESTITLIHIAQFLTGTTRPHLDKAAQLISPTLHKIITSPTILKVGVNIAADARRMNNFLNLRPQGIFELSDLHHTVVCAQEHRVKIPRKLVSLARLCLMHLELPLDKGPVRRSNWSLPISEKQAEYAAADAYAGLRIFDALERQRFQLVPRPKFPDCRNIAEEEEEYRPKTPVVEETTTETVIATTKTTRTSSTSSTPKRLKAADSPEFDAAKEWACKYKSENAGSQVELRNLRAWNLWSVQELPLGRVTEVLGVKEATAAVYVLAAIKDGKFAYEKERVAKDLLSKVGRPLQGHYRWLLGKDGWGMEDPASVVARNKEAEGQTMEVTV